MRRNFKFYFYSPEHSELREIKWFRLKFFGSILVSVVLALILLLGADYYVFDMLGFSSERVTLLTNENQVLHQRLLALTQEMQQIEKSIQEISQSGDELRLKENLAALSSDEKQAGVGGTAPSASEEGISSELNTLLGSASSLIERLSSQVKVQQESYAEILRKKEYNEEFFKHLPAIKPMEGYYGKNDFGMRNHPVLGVMKFHEGVDIINDIGTPVYAPADGTVEFAGHSGGGYGVILLIKHGYGYETLFGHLSKTIAKEGQKVKRGDLIARSGNTGLVSGPHLHYEVHLNGVLQNPLNYFFNDSSPQEYRTLVTRGNNSR
ncbi:MAG: M23 family peptidase [Bacteroidetes bacterium]|nr:MAG: M23 family peptidase [Bacteroidota bacterium]